MKKAKIKKKEENSVIEKDGTYSIKSIIKILLILVCLFFIFYIITFFLVKDRGNSLDDSQSVIDSSKIIMSQILNRNEEEYYVIATKPSLYSSSYVDTNYITLYNNYINTYKQKENAIPFYYINLDSALNKSYFGNDLNIVNDISQIKVNDEVLFKIKNSKIEKTYVGKANILDKLSRL